MRNLVSWALLAWLAVPGLAQEIADAPAGLYPLKARLSPWPPVPGKCRLSVDVSPPKEGPSELANLKMSLLMDMPATKMRPLMARLTRTRVGHYEGEVVLPMKGSWRIQFLLATRTGEFRVVSLVQIGPGKPGAPLPPIDPNCGPGELVDPNLKVVCSPNPPRVGENHLTIQIPPEQKVEKLMVGLDMAGMPMLVSPQAARSKGSGRYEADVDLPMSGVWQLRVDLDGRVPPPVLLNVNPAERRPINRPLLWLTLAAGIPLGVGLVLRKRPLAPLLAGVSLAATTFSAGAVLERYWPPLSEMEMGPGAPEMNAPTPVLLATVQKVPLSVYKTYPALVRPDGETVLFGGGVVREIAQADTAVRKGALLARVGSSRLLAPSDGVLIRQLAEVGQTLEPGAPVLAFSPIARVRVRAEIPNADRFLVQRGQAVDILEESGSLPGLLTTVSALSQGDHYWVEALIDNKGKAEQVAGHDGRLLALPKPADDGGRPGKLPIGQKVLMRCLVNLLPSALCIPKEAVFQSEGRSMVMVVSPVAGQQLSFRRAVTTGISSDTHTQILDGLKEGEMVVALAQEPLSDGTLVTAASWGVGSYRDLMIPEDAAHSP
ncbi:MAG: HlyD family efflux transporter periplasmic adaptor subunit [Candidatus Eremiobacteraeota bacterium]|nr:HlyD family efflux transporter periplasmic adaptor subunit [Candidatus Eremiobacteraeota bacterium]